MHVKMKENIRVEKLLTTVYCEDKLKKTKVIEASASMQT